MIFASTAMTHEFTKISEIVTRLIWTLMLGRAALHGGGEGGRTVAAGHESESVSSLAAGEINSASRDDAMLCWDRSTGRGFAEPGMIVQL